MKLQATVEGLLSVVEVFERDMSEPNQRIKVAFVVLADGVVVDFVAMVEFEGVHVALQSLGIVTRRVVLIGLSRWRDTFFILATISSSREFFMK